MTVAGRMLIVVSLVACVAPPTQLAPAQLSRTIAAPQSRVRAAAIRVLAEHGATIAMSDSAAGLVQTHPFTVENMWENDLVMNRIDCGKDMVGSSRALSEPVTLTLSVFTTPIADSTVVRIKATGGSFDRTARAGMATNPVAGAFAGANQCEIKAAFAKQLLDEIEAQTIKP